MLCTIYAKTVDGVDAAQCRLALSEFYKDEYFVKVQISVIRYAKKLFLKYRPAAVSLEDLFIVSASFAKYCVADFVHLIPKYRFFPLE